MIGPGGVEVPPSTQGLSLGGKTAGDLIESDVTFSVIGTNVRVRGTVKNITDPWTQFDKSNNTGHFVPILLPTECVGKQVKLTGLAKAKTVKIDDDRLLVLRLENLTGNTLTAEMDGKLLMTMDFSGVTRK